ncbi:MAG: DEAD/DEAH box helicase [Actinobacteria bacterium]|nr:DEAD/DEAH box helicase [Actinomycetota bacterium]MCA1806323.1 DEAD/DEAH box helicase [Actinomycetota bacterium]
MPTTPSATDAITSSSEELLSTDGRAPLYPFQVEGIDFLVKKRRAILADDMGLGKTRMLLEAVEKAGKFPCLIVVGLKTGFGVWQNEIKRWTGRDSLVYHGTPDTRKVLWEEWKPSETPYIITNNFILKELAELINWPALILDEYHLMGLRNRQTQTFKLVKKMRTGLLYFSSGSPIAQGPQDLWAPLNILDKKEFSSYWHFINRHCIKQMTYAGYEKIMRYPRNPKVFRDLVAPYMIRRLKKNVYKQMPSKIRRAIPIDFKINNHGERSAQYTLYRDISRKMMAELGNGEIVVTPAVISQIMMLRKLLVSPRLVGEDAIGAGMEALNGWVMNEFDSDNNVVVFTPFRDGVKLIAQHFKHKASSVHTVMGQMKPEEVTATIDAFQNGKKPRRLLVGTIKSAVSYTAHAASVVFFLGQEWSHNDNEQAEDRVHRIGQMDSVRVYYIQHMDTIEERIIETLMEKRDATSIILKQDHKRIIPA